MSEYFVGGGRAQAEGGDPLEPPLPGQAPDDETASGPTPLGSHAPVQGEQVRLGLPFNGVIPLWYEGQDITWHLTPQMDLSTLLGLGHIRTVPGPSPTPPGWSEQVEVATLTYAQDGSRTLNLQATAPTGRRAVNHEATGAPVALSEPLDAQEHIQGQVDDISMAIHVGRMMIRAARDGAILLFTLRAPRDPEAHHLLSVPSSVDDNLIMHFHLGTMLEMDGGAWERAARHEGMTLLDLDVPFEPLLVGGDSQEGQGLDAAGLVEMARPVVDCLLKPGFPFALGYSFVLPK